MKNRITISLPFSFKGQDFNPTCTVDLDEQMRQNGELPCLYTHLAAEAGISPYSYEHDVMMMGEMVFDHAEGLAAAYVADGEFDAEAFEQAWHQQKRYDDLASIARRRMEVASLDDVPELKETLLEAFELGREAGRAERQIHSTPMPGF